MDNGILELAENAPQERLLLVYKRIRLNRSKWVLEHLPENPTKTCSQKYFNEMRRTPLANAVECSEIPNINSFGNFFHLCTSDQYIFIVN